MITDIIPGDILHPSRRTDIIVGMNPRFADVFGIAKPFVSNISDIRDVPLGSVVSFKFDETRNLHLLICHVLGEGGWEKADQYVRYGLDYLWVADPKRKYSIVRIGTGRVGRRDGADAVAIHTAMVNSFLPVDLYIPSELDRMPAEFSARVIPFRLWNMAHGETKISLAA